MFTVSTTKKEQREVDIVQRLLRRTEPLSAAEAPPDPNPRVAANAVVDCLEWPLVFQSVSKLSDGVWREVMKRLSRSRRAMGPTAAFLMEATRGASDEAPRQTGASAAAFSKSLGLPAGHSKVEVWLESVRADGGEGRLAASFTLDPAARSWWWVWVERAHRRSLFESDGTVTFGAEGVGDDELNGKPPSAVEQVPAWLAAFGQRNKVTWRLERRVEGRLSPRVKARLVEWLLGTSP